LTIIAARPVSAAPRIKHLKRLEGESIGIVREVVAEFRNPVMLYSSGKDSEVIAHLSRKALSPPSRYSRFFASIPGGNSAK